MCKGHFYVQKEFFLSSHGAPAGLFWSRIDLSAASLPRQSLPASLMVSTQIIISASLFSSASEGGAGSSLQRRSAGLTWRRST